MNKTKERTKKIMKLRSKTILTCIILSLLLTACTDADYATKEVKDNADSFNLIRECTVYNTRSDKPLFHIIANFSLNIDAADEQLEIICQTKNKKRRHYIQTASHPI